MTDVLDALNIFGKIAFITYAWITMIRINAYIIEKHKREKEQKQ